MAGSKTAKKQGKGTREQLLESACKLFAEKGYRDTTIAEICALSGANIAAVNYYFQDKKRLYAEAWRLTFERSMRAHPARGDVSADAPAEKRLEGYVLSMLRRMLDPGNHEFDILRRELAHPTGLLARVMQDSIEPIRAALEEIVRELLGPKVPDRQVRLCQMSILAQCLHPRMRERFQRLFPGKARDALVLESPVEEIAEHITRFSLAGIREVRRRGSGGSASADGKAPPPNRTGNGRKARPR